MSEKTTTDKIIEAIRKKLIGVEETATYVGLIENLLPDIRSAIDSVIGEQDKIDWISVETELPIQNQYVYCYGKGDRQFSAMYKDSSFLAVNPFNDFWDEAEEVTHWQPLPAPPSQI